jgi:hypothetical protein
MNQVIENCRLPDRRSLIGGAKSSELMSAESSQGEAKKTEDSRNLSGNLHNREDDGSPLQFQPKSPARRAKAF